MTSPAENPPALFCPTCTYDLRYTTEPRCPECGTPFDRNDLATSRIPWIHRKQKSLGLFKAWLRTTLLVIRPSQRLAHEVALPIDPVAASRFRWLNVLLATLLLAAGNAAVYPFLDPDILRIHINSHLRCPPTRPPHLPLSRACPAHRRPHAYLFALPITAFTTALAALAWWSPFLFWITAAITPASPRAAALSYYLSAWLPIAVLVYFANPAILLSLRDHLGEPSTLAIVSVIILDVFTLFTCWIANTLLYARSTNPGIVRTTLFRHPPPPRHHLLLFYAVSPLSPPSFLLGLLALILASLTT